MKPHISVRLGLVSLAFVLAAVALPASAALDNLYPNSATWEVNNVADANVSPDFTVGANGHSTLDSDVYAADAIVVTAGWAIQNNAPAPGTDTSYPRTVTFTGVTSAKPPGADDVTVAAITNCTATSAASTCSTTISFAAPATPGDYSVQINTGITPPGGAGQLNTKQLTLNFTVAEDIVEMIDTKLTVDPQCLLLNAGDVDLTATLEELLSGDKIGDADIDFYIDPPSASIGTATTDVNGVATLVHNIDGLGVGDYTLYAEFLGDDVYNPSNDSDTLGISYLFLGFGEPINGDGTSIFGGRIIPIKIRLVDANGDPVTDATPTVWLTSYDSVNGVGEDLEQVSSVSSADTGNIMRYVPEDAQYIYNWDARDLVNGTYAIVVVLGDSPTCRAENPYAIITVAKKGGKK